MAAMGAITGMMGDGIRADPGADGLTATAGDEGALPPLPVVTSLSLMDVEPGDASPWGRAGLSAGAEAGLNMGRVGGVASLTMGAGGVASLIGESGLIVRRGGATDGATDT